MGVKLRANKKTYELIPNGMYEAVCSDIIDLGVQHSNGKYGEKDTLQVLIIWELPELTYEDADGNKHPRTVRKRYTQSTDAKATIRKHLESWRGRPFTEEELVEFDLDNVLGCGCQIQIMQEQSDDGGKTYENIKNIVPLKREYWTEPTHKTSFELKSDRLAEIEFLPEWIQKIIRQSETYKELTGGGSVGDDDLPFPEE